jgi:hypothetical protein
VSLINLLKFELRLSCVACVLDSQIGLAFVARSIGQHMIDNQMRHGVVIAEFVTL